MSCSLLEIHWVYLFGRLHRCRFKIQIKCLPSNNKKTARAANEYEPLLGSKGLTPAKLYMERLRQRFPNPWEGMQQVMAFKPFPAPLDLSYSLVLTPTLVLSLSLYSQALLPPLPRFRNLASRGTTRPLCRGADRFEVALYGQGDDRNTWTIANLTAAEEEARRRG